MSTRIGRPTVTIVLSDQEHETLERWARRRGGLELDHDRTGGTPPSTTPTRMPTVLRAARWPAAAGGYQRPHQALSEQKSFDIQGIGVIHHQPE